MNLTPRQELEIKTKASLRAAARHLSVAAYIAESIANEDRPAELAFLVGGFASSLASAAGCLLAGQAYLDKWASLESPEQLARQMRGLLSGPALPSTDKGKVCVYCGGTNCLPKDQPLAVEPSSVEPW